LTNNCRKKNLLAAYFLCQSGPEEIIKFLRPEWYEKMTASLEDKLRFLKSTTWPYTIFPFRDELPDNINFDAFCRSFFVQPDLFVRIRPEHKLSTVKKIKSAGLPYQLLNDDSCAQFPSGTKIDSILETDS
jgi:16S rRNA (cytosine967-C5)-methyltransferase